MNLIVVGAGIAGLSTAWSLAKAGRSVDVDIAGLKRCLRAEIA